MANLSLSPSFKQRFLGKAARDNLRGYLFISPWLIGMTVFIAYPVLATFYFALTNYTVLNPPQWTGLDNFQRMFTQDPLYWRSVGNTVTYSALVVPLQLAVGLGLAMLLNANLRGIGFYRTAFYLPGLLPSVASGLLWILVLDPRLGIVNQGLDALGLPIVGWFRSAAWSKPGLILVATWSGSGATMLIFLAGLKDIPQSLLEAATIDGANAWQRLRFVTLPLLTPTIFFNLLIGLINSFQVFAIAFVAISPVTGATTLEAGPLNSLLMYVVHLYRSGFRHFDMGYASAMALVMFVALVVISLVLFSSSNYWVFYEAGRKR